MEYWHGFCETHPETGLHAGLTPNSVLETAVNLLKTTLLAAAVLAAPLAAHAEATFTTGTTTPITPSARLDFKVTIPKILLRQVGTNNATINAIDFDMTSTASNVGNGTAVAGTGGDLSGGKVSAKVQGNNGNITLSAITTGALTSTGGDTIPYSEILASSNNASLAPPQLQSGATTSTTLTAVNKVVNQSAEWTYTYKNTAIVAPGVYGGGGAGNTGNGRVTYTASMP